MTKDEFLKDVGNWSNHRYLLWEALEKTTGRVVEFGSGEGSTKFLSKYCQDNKRDFLSFDSNLEWANNTGAQFISNWDRLDLQNIDVLLIDHAPGERRWIDIEKYKDIAKVIVIHDSEPSGHGYMLDKIWHLFPYRIDTETTGAWATLVSNHFKKETWEHIKTTK